MATSFNEQSAFNEAAYSFGGGVGDYWTTRAEGSDAWTKRTETADVWTKRV